MNESSSSLAPVLPNQTKNWLNRLNRLRLPVIVLILGIWAFNTLKNYGVFDGYLVPEVKVAYRSALGPGYVLLIANAGSKPLFNVRVACSDWDKSYRVTSQLSSGSWTEAGWLELPEGIKKGHTYSIYADGYAFARNVHLPVH
jgi:hypothetical protein